MSLDTAMLITAAVFAAPTLYRHCLPEMLAVLTVWALFKLTGVP